MGGIVRAFDEAATWRVFMLSSPVTHPDPTPPIQLTRIDGDVKMPLLTSALAGASKRWSVISVMSNAFAPSDPFMTIAILIWAVGGPLVELTMGGVSGHFVVPSRAMQTLPTSAACALGREVGERMNSPDIMMIEIRNTTRILVKVRAS